MRKRRSTVSLRQSDLTISYSWSERRLFEFLPKDGRPITTKDLAKRYYASLGPPPFHGRKIILGIVDSLRAKVEHNKEGFTIAKSPRRGPSPIEVSISLQ